MTAAFAYVNLADAATISGSSSAALAPYANLQNKHIKRRWVGTLGVTEYLTIDLGASIAWDTLALVGTNLGTTATTQVRASNSDATGVTGEIYNSGSVSGRIDGNYGALIILRPTTAAARYVRIDLSQSGTTIKAGRLFIGLRSSLAVNFSVGWSREWIDPTRKVVGVSGQSFEDILATYRIVSITFDAISEAERNGLIESIDRDLGAHGDFLFIEDTASANLGRDSIWGYRDSDSPVTEPFISTNRVFAKSISIRERK